MTVSDLDPQSVPSVLVERLSKHFGELAAVDDISFAVPQGEVFAFLGPNGAGKTTTIRILCTLARPTSGRAIVAGHDVVTQPTSVRRHIGLVFQDQTLDEQLTATENLRFHAVLYGVARETVQSRIDQVLELVGLADRATELVSNFSGGMARRLEIARALLHTPNVLFLDEPTVGLDPQTRARMWEDVLRLRDEEGVTIFFTTHYMDEAEYADRIAIIDQGKIAALDSPAALKAAVGQDTVRLNTADDDAALDALTAARYRSTPTNDGVVVHVDDGARAVPTLIDATGVSVRQVTVHQPDLDDVFMHFTGREIRSGGAEGLSLARRFMAARRR